MARFRASLEKQMKKRTSDTVSALPSDKSVTVRVEKIHNGFLAHHSESGPKGYSSKTVYHPTMPKIQMPSIPLPNKGKK